MSISIPIERLLEMELANQRASVRYRCGPALPGRLFASTDFRYQRVWIRDISRTGIGILSDRPLDENSFLVVQIRSLNSGEKYDLPVQVMHCTQLGNEWLLGCEFIHSLEDDSLDDLL